MLRPFLWVTLFTLLAFPSISNAYCSRSCWEDHSKVSMKTHAQKFVEDLSASRDQRLKAMECLSFYGKEGVPILSRVLERELNDFDSIRYALEALERIQDRSVMEPMLRLLGNEGKGSQQSRADWNATASRKLKPYFKEWAVEILGQLAFTSLEEPNPQFIKRKVTKTAGGWTISFGVVHEPISFRVCGGYYSKGESLRRAEINRITEVLKKIAASEPEDTTEAEKRFFRAASKGLDRIERRMALLEKYGPKSKKALESMPKQKREKGKPGSISFVGSNGETITFTVLE